MTRTRFLTGALLLLLAAPVIAQGPPGGGPGGGGGGMSPEMQKMMAQAKYRRQMRDQMRAIGEINRDPATALNPTQAKQILTVVKPWTTKEKMSEEEAKGIMRAVKKVLTPKQLTAVGNYKPQRGFGGGPGGGGGDREGGQRRAGGQGGPGGPGGPGGFGGGGGQGRPGGFDPARMAARMQTANFLSTKVDPNNQRSSRRAESNKAFIAMLQARARGVSTAKR